MICYLVFDDSYTKESNIRDIVRGYYEFLLSEVKKTELFFDLLVKTGAETPQKQENATL